MTNQTPGTIQDELDSKLLHILANLPEYPRGKTISLEMFPELVAYIQANYLPRKDVVKAIGEVVPNTESEWMNARNDLRQQIRTKLGLDANGEGE